MPKLKKKSSLMRKSEKKIQNQTERITTPQVSCSDDSADETKCKKIKNQDYMRKKRQDDVTYCERERERKYLARHDSTPGYDNERKRSRERMQTLRKDAEYADREREENQMRMAATRECPDYTEREREENQMRMAATRECSKYTDREQKENQLRMTSIRTDADYFDRERNINKARLVSYRADAIFADNECQKRKSRQSKAKQSAAETEKRKANTSKTATGQRDANIADRSAEQRDVNIADRVVEQRDVNIADRVVEQRDVNIADRAVEQRDVNNVAMEDDNLADFHQFLQRKDVAAYNREIKEGPTYACTCCGSLWFKKNVRSFKEQTLIDRDLSPEFIEKYYHCAHTAGGRMWICTTCHNSVKEGKVPRLSLGNGLHFPPLPLQLQDLTPLEERLVSPRIPFMQIRPLGVDRQHGLKGNVVNVPVEVSTNVSVLPRSFSNAQTIQLKLMRKMCYRGHYIFETVRPNAVYEAARVLVDTPLYREHGVTTLAENWLQQHPLLEESFVADAADTVEDRDAAVNVPAQPRPSRAEDQPRQDEDQEEEEWDETIDDEPVNPGADETLLDSDEAVKFAPGEGQKPLPVVLDKDCEELAFPTIYAGQRRGQPDKVSYAEIAKSEARRYDRRATKVPKLFFSYKKMEMLRISGSVQTCLRKKTQDKSYTARDVLDQGTVGDIVSTDQGFHVLRPVRGSPPFWEQKKKELLAMVRQLGCPTFFFTLSAAETKWTELLIILFRIMVHDDIDPDEIENWTFLDKTKLIRDDPVTCARYFDHRFRALFNKVIKSKAGPLGEVIDFFYRVEFQHRGSPHIHGLLWIKDAPAFHQEDKESESDVTNFIDKHITCHKPLENEPLHAEVQLQQHKHSHTCLKQSGKEKSCRFHIPKFPMPETRVLQPLKLDEVSDSDKTRLKTLAKATNDKLKKLEKDAATLPTFVRFLEEIGCTEEEYVLCIRSTLKRPEVFLKRELGEGRSNSYNQHILALWKANMDIQFVVDPYACVMYIINYVGKSQRGMSTLLRGALSDVRKGNGTVREKLRAVANCFLNSSEISAQEACYYLLRMSVSQSSRSCVFINTGRPEKRIRMLKADAVLKELDPESTDVMCSNILDKYAARPESMENLCLSEFAADYNMMSKDPGVNKPHDDEDDNEDRHGNTDNNVQLDNGLGYVTKRKWPRIIRYCNFNKLKDEQEYYREQLMLFHPWRNEETDLINICHEHAFKTHEEAIGVIRRKFVATSCDDAVRDAEELQNAGEEEEVIEGIVPLADLDEEEIGSQPEDFQAMEDEQGRQVDVLEQIGQPAVPEKITRFLSPGRIPDQEFEQLLSSMNATQSKYVMHCVHAFKTGKLPLYEFVSGGAGVGKSRLIKVLHQALIRYFGSIPGAQPDDTIVLLCAPTGKAAFNIGGMTLHSALSLPLSQYGGTLPSLSADISNTLATQLHSLKLIIIDEISMVGVKMLTTISERLCQIFKTKEPFGGISVLAVGDFNQLPPVADSFPFATSKSGTYAELAGPVLWSHFRLIELTEIMRQREDLLFAQALSNLVKGPLTRAENELFKSRQVYPQDVPDDVLHLFPTNALVNDFNEDVLSKMDTEGTTFTAQDTCQGDASHEVKETFKQYVRGLATSETYGLPYELNLKVSARYMMTNNVETSDGLVNGATGRLKLIQYSRSATVRKPFRVWIEFDDPEVGRTMRGNNKQIMKNLKISPSWTPVDPVCRVARRKQGGGNLQLLRKQFPLVPAMAMTIHKSQGDTYNRVAVHLARGMKRASLYVACSRAKTADGLYLLGDFSPPNAPSATDKVVVEMKRLRELMPVEPCIAFLDEHTGPELKIAFHNVQSLRKHHSSMHADRSFLAADLLLFVETRTTVADRIHFVGFERIYERVCPPYGTSVYAKEGLPCTVVNDTVKQQMGHIEVTTVRIQKQDATTLVTVVYKSPKTPYRVLKDTLGESLESMYLTERLMCLGDFNIDRSKPEGHTLATFMQEKSLTALLPLDCPTTNQGTQIDQCFCNIPSARAGTGESMTSYHKPLWVIV